MLGDECDAAGEPDDRSGPRGEKPMRSTFVDPQVRNQALLAGAVAWVAAGTLAVVVTQLDAGLLRMVIGIGVGVCVLSGVAAMCLPLQQRLLGRPVTRSPRSVARFGGAMLAAVAGPLLTAKLLVVLIAFAGSFMVETDGAGAYAGIGVAWLILPMALLVTGTAALKLPALAAGRAIDTGEAIALADGREWSLVPLGIALTLPFMVIAAGTVLAATGVLWGLALLIPGVALFLPANAALARRWQRLQPA